MLSSCSGHTIVEIENDGSTDVLLINDFHYVGSITSGLSLYMFNFFLKAHLPKSVEITKKEMYTVDDKLLTLVGYKIMFALGRPLHHGLYRRFGSRIVILFNKSTPLGGT